MRGGFWSERRAAVAAEAEAELEAVEEAKAAAIEAELAEKDDAEILDELGLPEPEALDSPEAVRDFMQSAVPQRLKTRALRRLWRLNPVLANLDGLVDYGEDYTDAATVIENLQTAYQVGKGMLAHVEEMARQAEAKAAAEDAAPDDAIEDVEEPQEPMPVVLAEAPASEIAEAYADEADDVAPVALRPRRMKFRFEEHA